MITGVVRLTHPISGEVTLTHPITGQIPVYTPSDVTTAILLEIGDFLLTEASSYLLKE